MDAKWNAREWSHPRAVLAKVWAKPVSSGPTENMTTLKWGKRKPLTRSNCLLSTIWKSRFVMGPGQHFISRSSPRKYSKTMHTEPTCLHGPEWKANSAVIGWVQAVQENNWGHLEPKIHIRCSHLLLEKDHLAECSGFNCVYIYSLPCPKNGLRWFPIIDKI